jgi:Pyruvate/2-oxoacid:ferredoxin oxidoreductase delta subunit
MAKIKLSERIKKAPWFFSIEPYLREQDNPVSSHPEAREPRIVPLVIIDYGSFTARLKQMRYEGLKEYFINTLREMHVSAKSIKKNPYAGKKTIDSETLRALENYAKELGVAEVGYTKVNSRYIFKDFRILFDNAIVFSIEMDKDKIKGAPNMESFKEVFRTYHQVGLTVNKVADFLRERGYNAHAGPAGGGDVNYIPIAIDAGLGIAGKHGLLMTKDNGPRVRLAAVYTDIENLPFSQNNPHGWIKGYCESCIICVEKCPVEAIYMEPKTLSDGGPEYIDHTKCAVPFSNDNGCTLCIKYCPLSYGDYNKIKAKYEAEHSQECI